MMKLANYAGRRRNDLDICSDVIKVALTDGGAGKTRIVYQANLNFKLAERYLNRLITSGMLIVREKRYFATSKGKKALKEHERLIRSMTVLQPQVEIVTEP